jgi:hypothetical protein
MLGEKDACRAHESEIETLSGFFANILLQTPTDVFDVKIMSDSKF